jgi:hypothetical protein
MRLYKYDYSLLLSNENIIKKFTLTTIYDPSGSKISNMK